MALNIKFLDLHKQQQSIKKELDVNIQAVFNHARFIMGPEVSKLEEKLEEFSSAKHCITCASGTDALILSMMALKIGKGDAVFCPSFTFPATAEAVLIVGATPVFIDVSKETYNLCYSDLIKKIDITKKSKLMPKAIIAVDLFGLPANYNKLKKISNEYSLKIISDAAQSFGASFDEKKVGTLGDITCTSFFPAKPLGCFGDGGAVFTDNKIIKDKIKSLRAHGKGEGKYEIVDIGLNSRLDTIQAAILLSKITVFEWENSERNRLAKIYNEEINSFFKTPQVPNKTQSVWAQYTLQSNNRDNAIGFLNDNGIPTMVYYPVPMHMQPAYKKFSNNVLPKSEDLSRKVFSIPIHAYLSESEQNYIIEKLILLGKLYN